MIRAHKGRHVPSAKFDPRQADFLSLLEGAALPEQLSPAQPAAGKLAFDQRMRRLLNEAIAAGPYANREQLAEVVSSYVGRKVSKSMIDSWTGASRPHAFPGHMVPAFCAALGNSILLTGLAEASGCAVTEGAALIQSRLERLTFVIRLAKAEQRRMLNELPMFGYGRRP